MNPGCWGAPVQPGCVSSGGAGGETVPERAAGDVRRPGSPADVGAGPCVRISVLRLRPQPAAGLHALQSCSHVHPPVFPVRFRVLLQPLQHEPRLWLAA